ncbi:hypothetical protein [Paenibacillus alginolyticus]|uniref:hypothetical protein n=2 Tax=Paenibacillus alginolyticus TaxID=59839 RepID=UPI00040C8ADF|nr:hypothetical protein [Paenibacillus alginolyticus]
MKLKSIQSKFMLLLVPLIVVTLFGIVAFAYVNSKGLINNEIGLKMQQQLESVTSSINGKLIAHRKVGEVLARTVEFAPNQLTLDNYNKILSLKYSWSLWPIGRIGKTKKLLMQHHTHLKFKRYNRMVLLYGFLSKRVVFIIIAWKWAYLPVAPEYYF